VSAFCGSSGVGVSTYRGPASHVRVWAFSRRSRVYGRGVSIEIPTPEAVNEFFAREFPSAYAVGHRCVETGPGLAVARWPYDPTSLRPGGFISGPTQFAIADVAFWFMTFTLLGLAPMAVTSEIYIVFLRPAVGGDLLARAELLRAGKSKMSGTVRVWVDGAPDRPVAQVTGSYVHMR
jgi:uncharacterized protein (TIGR00369 family)